MRHARTPIVIKLNRRTVAWALALAALGYPLKLVASNLTLPHSFVNGTVADADQVNANFAAVEAAVDDNDARISALENAAAVDTSARVFNSTNLSVAFGCGVPPPGLSFDSERWDTDSIHDTATNTSRLTANTAGKYLIFGHVFVTSGGTGVLAIRLNGTTIVAAESIPAGSGSGSSSLTTHYSLAANDFVELTACSGGGGVVSASLNDSPEFGMVKLP